MNRIKIAIEFLKEGHSFTVGELLLGIKTDDILFVTGWSQSLSMGNLTKRKALAELEGVKYIFDEMVSASFELSDFVRGKNTKFNLAFNYGMGSIGICSEEHGIIKWEVELPG